MFNCDSPKLTQPSVQFYSSIMYQTVHLIFIVYRFYFTYNAVKFYEEKRNHLTRDCSLGLNNYLLSGTFGYH